MIKKEELKVGERVTITLEAVERNNCECCKFNRSDCKNIIFKEVKVQKKEK